MKILLCLLFVFLLAWDYPWQNNSFNFIWVLEIWHKQYLRIALWGIKVIVDICAVLWTHVENSQIHILYASQSEIFFFFIISSCFLVILYYEAEPINIFNLMNKDFFWGGGNILLGHDLKSWFYLSNGIRFIPISISLIKVWALLLFFFWQWKRLGVTTAPKIIINWLLKIKWLFIANM